MEEAGGSSSTRSPLFEGTWIRSIVDMSMKPSKSLVCVDSSDSECSESESESDDSADQQVKDATQDTKGNNNGPRDHSWSSHHYMQREEQPLHTAVFWWTTDYTGSNLQRKLTLQFCHIHFWSRTGSCEKVLRSADAMECTTMCAILSLICPRRGSGRTLLCLSAL